jgi:uncharacterized caspase-like protein
MMKYCFIMRKATSGTLRGFLAVVFVLMVLAGCSLKRLHGEAPPFRIIAATVSRTVLVTNDDSLPREVADSFSSYDRQIVSHVRYANFSGCHTFRWEWYRPDGVLYHATQKLPVETSEGSYVREGTSWHKIPVTEAMTRNYSGRWKVDIYMDDLQVASDAFVVKPPGEEPGFGTYQALVIGNNRYQSLKALNTAENDARAVAKVLQEDYGFKVNLLINGTRADIIMALNRLRNSLSETDNLVIFYAGHGFLDRAGDEGYWMPVDAASDSEINWISNSYIATILKATAARHVLIISDSCYSGTLTRRAEGSQVRLKDLSYYKNIAGRKSRSVLSSGGVEPVMDGGGKGGHSIFTAALLDALKSGNGMMDSTALFNQIRHAVMLNSSQTPEYSSLRNAGDEGGDLVFVRK